MSSKKGKVCSKWIPVIKIGLKLTTSVNLGVSSRRAAYEIKHGHPCAEINAYTKVVRLINTFLGTSFKFIPKISVT